jgi:hypothetical protein
MVKTRLKPTFLIWILKTGVRNGLNQLTYARQETPKVHWSYAQNMNADTPFTLGCVNMAVLLKED